MNIKARLTGRIHMNDIREIIFLTQDNDKSKRDLYNLLFDNDDKVAYQAAWVLTHLPPKDNEWLYDKQDKLIDEALVCEHSGKRRLLLALLFKQPLPATPRVDFLDFCLERMVSRQELPGVQTLCMKLAYEMCRNIPELKQELFAILDMIEPDLQQASMRAACKNVLKAMKTGRSL